MATGMPMKVREVVRMLEKAGWIQLRVKGSHRQFRHPSKRLVVTVPGSDGKDLALGTMKDILKKADLI